MNQKIKIKHLLLSQSLWLRTLSTTQPHGNTSTVRQHFQRSCRNISEIDFIYRWERLSLPVADFHRSVTSSSVYTLACVWYEWIRELRGGKAHRMISLLYGEKKKKKCLGFFIFYDGLKLSWQSCLGATQETAVTVSPWLTTALLPVTGLKLRQQRWTAAAFRLRCTVTLITLTFLLVSAAELGSGEVSHTRLSNNCSVSELCV